LTGEAAPAVSNVSLRLMTSFEAAAAGVMVAARAGVFDHKGLRLEIHRGSKADDPISSVTDGSDTFGLARADTLLLARARGAPSTTSFRATPIENR
jgi:ABC-type nitrate/sulfonate/bicarbonate transport system substrate-binding protein